MDYVSLYTKRKEALFRRVLVFLRTQGEDVSE